MIFPGQEFMRMKVTVSQATDASPESWLNMQTKLNLWKALKSKPRNIAIFPRLEKIAI